MNRKSAIILAAALAVASPCTAQTSPPPQHAASGALGKPLSRQAVLSALTCKLDTKKSKVGDVVTAKTLNPLKLNGGDGTVLPRGTILTGRVTQVQAKSSGGATLAILLDRMKTPGGEPAPVRGFIAAIAPEPSLADGGGSTKDLPMGSGGDPGGRLAAMTGTSIQDGNQLLPPIAAGSAVKGVALDPVPAADGSTLLRSNGKDIKLDNGTRLEIGLVAAD
jgi:hypothetical protein